MATNGTNPEKEPTLEPGDLLDHNDQFCLQHKDILTLLKYIWTGYLLPLTVDDYKKGINAQDLEQEVIDEIVNPMLETFKIIQADTKYFKDDQTHGYDSIVAVANNVYDYASNSGGNADDSFYANIIKGVADLQAAHKASPKNQKNIDDAQQTVKELVQYQKEQIESLVQQANGAVQNLKDFENKSQTSLKQLRDHQGKVSAKFEGEGGEIKKLEDDLKTKREDLRKDEEEYEHDVVVTCTALTYVWFFPVGTIAAGVTMGVYGKKATDMKATIDAIKGLISSEEKEIAKDKAIVAQLNMITAELSSLVETAQAAIKVIEIMIGYWNGVSADLSAIETMVEKTQSGGLATIMRLSQKKIISKWNTLRDSAKKYREIAYVNDVEVVDLQNWASSTGKQ